MNGENLSEPEKNPNLKWCTLINQYVAKAECPNDCRTCPGVYG